jgi:hypothetical protein
MRSEKELGLKELSTKYASQGIHIVFILYLRKFKKLNFEKTAYYLNSAFYSNV